MHLFALTPFRRLLQIVLPLLASSLLGGAHAASAAAASVVDDFTLADQTRTGAARLLFTDKDLGSQSQATQTCENGVLRVEGELIPARGLPAFISVPLLLSPEAKPQDVSGHTGVRLRVKIIKGILTVQVASSVIDNFDYHTSGPVAAKAGEFQEIKIPFKDLKRGWSEQTALDLTTITSVNLVSFGMVRDTFSYEIDEIGFY